MKNLLVFFFLGFTMAYGQQVRISGKVISESGKVVPYALVADSSNQQAVYANSGGEFQIFCSTSNSVLHVSHVAYKNVVVQLHVISDTLIAVQMPELEIEEVLVKGSPLSKQTMLGVNFLDSKTIQNIPSFFGEPDIVKAVTVLPGISSGLDIYSGIFVRGGNRDQNMFLVDDARYYNTTHAGGLLSLFNPEIVKHIDVYKGVAPSRFGGAVSSVVDIQLNEGTNYNRFNMDLGTLRSGFVFESKGNGKIHAFMAGRFAHLNLIYGSAFKTLDFTKAPGEGDEEFKKFGFWDIDAKLRYNTSNRTLFSFGFHTGKDESASYRSSTGYLEGVENVSRNTGRGTFINNNNATFNFKHLFTSGLTLKNTGYFTHYALLTRNREEYFSNASSYSSYMFEEQTYMVDLTDKLELIYPLSPKHLLTVGGKFSKYWVNPQNGRHVNSIEGLDTLFGYPNMRADEYAFFAEDHMNISNKLKCKVGLRLSTFNTNDTLFVFPEPRVQLSYEFIKDWALTAGYAVNTQPFHVLVQTYGYFEKENWILANKEYKPQLAHQISGGIAGTLPNTTIDVSLETYYKTMENLLFLNPVAYETKDMFDYVYRNGEGQTYGTELYLKKSNGKLQWDIAYTLAWSQRRFSELNNYNWYFSEFDRRHDLTMGIHYFSGKKNCWNFNYLIQTGRPFTMPDAYMPGDDFFQGYYIINQVNNRRMPTYRRFDVSYKRIGHVFRCKTELTLSVMNVFARKNPFTMYVKNGNLYMNSLYRVIPSVNLKFFFLEK